MVSNIAPVDPAKSLVAHSTSALEVVEHEKDKTARELLKPEELEQAVALAQRIDVMDQNAIAMLGADPMKKVDALGTRFSSKVEEDSGDEVFRILDAVEKMVSDTPKEDFQLKLRRACAKFPLLKMLLSSLVGKAKSANDLADSLVKQLELKQDTLIEDNVMYEVIADEYLVTRRQLLIVAAAAEISLDQAHIDLDEKRKEAEASKDPEKAIMLQRFEGGMDRLDRQSTYLQQVAYNQLIAIPNADQIRGTNLNIYNTITTQIYVLVPEWKVQLAMRLGVKRSEAALTASERANAAFRETTLRTSRTIRDTSIRAEQSSGAPVFSAQDVDELANNLKETFRGIREARAVNAETRGNLRVAMANMTDSVTQFLAEDGLSAAPSKVDRKITK